VRRFLPLCVALVAAALLAGPAQTQPLSIPAPELVGVASAIAGQHVDVRCWINDATPSDPDSNPNAWGYVRLDMPVIYLDPTVCAGALALKHGEMKPLWQLALGALILTHESYHLKIALPESRRGNEAQTECRAIKRVPQTLLDLGASQELADIVLPWAIAEHFKISTFQTVLTYWGSISYNYPSCRVPVFSAFWP
jgi:hypothetical protein